MPRVIVVEDDARVRASLVAELLDEELEVEAFDRAEAAAVRLEPGHQTDLLLVDVRLSGQSGIELVRQLVGRACLPPTIVISGEATISETVEALRLGVFDFIEKPFGRERIRTAVRNALERAALEGELESLRSTVGEESLIGISPGMVALRERIASAARSPSTVLVRGESGSGKELVAAALHRLSPRHKGPFIKVNCAAIAASLVEDELFGHERGAFTDARESKAGLFEAANGGTLLLDEIGDMESALQARLLRVLEDGRVRRLGGTREITVDVRVVASTHRDLQAAVRDGRFRGDLYYRLACLEIEVPPLRERPADVPLLAAHFVGLACRQNRMRPKGIDAEALRGLERHAWPGNVRELRHASERAVIFGGDPVLLVDFSLSSDRPGVEASRMLSLDGAPALTLREFRSRCEREYILHVMKQEAWALPSAAQRLGLKRTYLYAKLAALGILRPS